MEKLQTGTADLMAGNIERLAELFPQVATEVTGEDGQLQRAIDFDALRGLLGDVAEGGRECYQFTWPGKQEARAEAFKPVGKTLRPCLEKSVDWDTTRNLYIEGDNLDALKILHETYAGKVKLIYIDPPYNTGKDFIYHDDYRLSREDYEAASGEFDEEGGRLVANMAGNGRFHSDWCSMMYPRLLLARDLLREDGAIFISIDDNEAANLRKLCDEVFGAGNFEADVAWQKTYSPRNDSGSISVETEHVLAYTRTGEWAPNHLARTAEMDARYDKPDGDPRPWKAGDATAPGASTHHGMVYAIQHPITGKLLYPSNGRHWSFGQEQMLAYMGEWAGYELRELDDAARRAEVCGCSTMEIERDIKGIVLSDASEATFEASRQRHAEGCWPRLYFTGGGKGGMACKRYLDTVEDRMPTNLWPYDEVGHTDEATKELKSLFDNTAPFDTPKPVRLMKRILDIATDSDSLVLDFFSGSASMAHAVMQANVEDGGTRRYIMVQLPEETSGAYATIADIGEERIRRAGAKIASELGAQNAQLKLGGDPKPLPDIGFRVLRVDSSNFRDVSATPEETTQATLLDAVDNVKAERSELDLLFEVLPALRIPYDASIEERQVAGKRCFVVDGGYLIACFDEGVTTAAIEQIAKLKPVYAVMRDASMADDATQANFEELFRTHSPETVRRVI